MIIIIRYFLYVSIFLLFGGCVNKDRNLESKLQIIGENSYFSLDSIEVSDWDTVYILTPYVDIEGKLKLSVSEKLKYELGSKSYDHLCSLIFIKEGEIISYYDVNRSIADFSFLDTTSCRFGRTHVYLMDANRKVLINK